MLPPTMSRWANRLAPSVPVMLLKMIPTSEVTLTKRPLSVPRADSASLSITMLRSASTELDAAEIRPASMKAEPPAAIDEKLSVPPASMVTSPPASVSPNIAPLSTIILICSPARMLLVPGLSLPDGAINRLAASINALPNASSVPMVTSPPAVSRIAALVGALELLLDWPVVVRLVTVIVVPASRIASPKLVAVPIAMSASLKTSN